MSVVARRYAKAIFALAREEQSLEASATELEQLAAVARTPFGAAMLANPLLSRATRVAVAGALADQLHVRPTMRNFLGVLADAHRLNELGSIFDHYQHLVDEALGQVRVQIAAATPLQSGQQEQIVTTFERLTGKRVLPAVRIDPELLGGVIVEVHGKVYDGSLRNQLGRLAGAIAGSRAYL